MKIKITTYLFAPEVDDHSLSSPGLYRLKSLSPCGVHNLRLYPLGVYSLTLSDPGVD